MEAFRYLDGVVYPSDERTMAVANDEIYGGAHRYYITNCYGFNNGKTEYSKGEGQTLQFVKKEEDGNFTAGIQDEQLILILLDRLERLNNIFPSEQYEKKKLGLEMFLEACKERIDDRIARNVMGTLKQ